MAAVVYGPRLAQASIMGIIMGIMGVVVGIVMGIIRHHQASTRAS